MSALIIQAGKNRGKKLVLPEDREVVIGRDETCHVRLASAAISRQHCALRCTKDGILVRDLGSQNGTMVNDAVIETEVLLQPGDTLSVGPMVFQVAGTKAGTSANSKPSSTRSVTDDNIANWLADEDAPDARSPLDSTTIIPKDSATTSDTMEIPSRQPSAPKAPLPVKQKVFRTVAEEGADIIRRYLESVPEDGGRQG